MHGLLTASTHPQIPTGSDRTLQSLGARVLSPTPKKMGNSTTWKVDQTIPGWLKDNSDWNFGGFYRTTMEKGGYTSNCDICSSQTICKHNYVHVMMYVNGQSKQCSLKWRKLLDIPWIFLDIPWLQISSNFCPGRILVWFLSIFFRFVNFKIKWPFQEFPPKKIDTFLCKVEWDQPKMYIDHCSQKNPFPGPSQEIRPKGRNLANGQLFASFRRSRCVLSIDHPQTWTFDLLVHSKWHSDTKIIWNHGWWPNPNSRKSINVDHSFPQMGWNTFNQLTVWCLKTPCLKIGFVELWQIPLSTSLVGYILKMYAMFCLSNSC